MSRRLVGLLVGFAVAASSPDRARAQSEAWRVHGVSDMQQLGKSVAFLGDVNGDGVPDYVVGGPAHGFDNPGNGHAVVCSGADGSRLFEFVGAFGASFGVAVEDAGDVDGDGVDDVAVGAPLDGNGAVYVYSSATHALLRTLTSASTGSQFGSSLANLGDLDGDGVADLAVGAPNDGAGGSDLGLAVIYSGASGSVLAQWSGAASGGGFGSVVGDAGDVDGDGVRDVLVVEQADTTSGTAEGTLRIYSGKTFLLLEQWSLGAHGGGWSANGAGDVDGDGLDDLIVSNVEWPMKWDYTIGDYDNGGVWVFSSASGSILASYTKYHHISGAVAGVGDVDGDGFGDFAFGTGEFDSKFFVISGKTGTVLTTGIGVAATLRRGVDLNGDGVAEIAVGMPDDSTAGIESGVVGIFDPIQQAYLFETPGNNRVDHVGWSCALLDDVNGDGTRDVLAATGISIYSVGRARVLSGVDGSELRVHEGAALSDWYGFTVAALPDLDADSIGEYAIATPGAQGAGLGWVEIRSGATGSLIRTLAVSGGTGNRTFGWSCAAAIQPSGAIQLAVGAPPVFGSGLAGAVYVFDVATGSSVVTAFAPRVDDEFGYSVAFLGDVDGDGTGDWATGVPEAHSWPYNSYFVVFSGATGNTIYTRSGIGGTGLGAGICGAGDVDGDGTPDLLVGEPSVGSQLEGMVYLQSGATWGLLRSWTGDHANAGIGQSLTRIGDVNGDGFEEFLCGDAVDGRAQLISGGTGGLLCKFHGSMQDDDFAGFVAGVAAPGSTGSMNGDAIPDVAIGAPDDSTNGMLAGRLSLYDLDDLYLGIVPSSAKSGDTVTLTTSGAPAGNPAAVFLITFDGSPFVAPIAFGTLDSTGIWSLSGVVPSGLSGHACTLKSFAIGFKGKVADSGRMKLTFE